MNRPELKTMFAGHELAVVEDGPVPRWRLTRPDNDNTVLINDTPKGVAICCGKQWRTSTIPLSDFVGELDPNYLAEKFGLPKRRPEDKNLPEPAGIGWDRFSAVLPEDDEEDAPQEYSAHDLALLAAIHARFRETFMAKYRLVGGRVEKRAA